MIVCNICGDAVSELGSRCLACSGKGIEKATPLKSLLTPTQRKGSPDRWARRYTTPPGTANGSPLAAVYHSHTPSALGTPHVDLRLEPEAELARVCGTVFDAPNVYPCCAACLQPIQLGGRLYIAPMDSGNVRASESTCRSCYTKLFAIGTCVACTKPIVGDREEGHRGAHVKGRGTSMWHAACFRCSFCQGSLYRQDHLLTPSGKPACVSCFEKSLHSPPLQLPAAPGPANSKRSYARPRSMLGPAQGASPAPSRPKLATKELVTTPHRPRIGAGSIEGVGSVRKLAARFDANNPPEERSTRLRDMKQSIAELDRHLGQAR